MITFFVIIVGAIGIMNFDKINENSLSSDNVMQLIITQEEMQKFMILDFISDSHSLKEEQQKVFLLETLLNKGKSKSK